MSATYRSLKPQVLMAVDRAATPPAPVKSVGLDEHGRPICRQAREILTAQRAALALLEAEVDLLAPRSARA